MEKKITAIKYSPYGINGSYYVYDNEHGCTPMGYGSITGTKKKIKEICDELNGKYETKEVKEGGELFTGGDWEHDLHYGRSTARIYTGEGIGEYNICALSGNAHTDEVKANAALISQAPAMYAFIKEMAERYSNSEWIAGRAKEILQKATPKK